MGSLFRGPAAGGHARGGRPGVSRARPDRRAGSPVDRLSRRFRGQPAERDGPPRTGRGRARGCSGCSERPSPSAGRPAGPTTSPRGHSRKPGVSSRARSACPIKPPWPKPGLGPAGTTCGSTRKRRTVAFDREGIRINLGSIGKGYAIDRAVELIRGSLVADSALVHGGPVEPVCPGLAARQFGGRWEIALRNPFEPESPLGRSCGCGTEGSGPRARRSSSSSSTAGSTATSSTRGRASRRSGRPA